MTNVIKKGGKVPDGAVPPPPQVHAQPPPPPPPPRGLAEKVERAVVYTPRPGDVVVLEVGRSVDLAEAEKLRGQAEEVFGSAARIAFLGTGIRFAGVVRETETR